MGLRACLLVALVVAGCGANGGGSPLEGEWFAQVSPVGAVGLTFNPDGTYTFVSILVTSSTASSVSAEMQAEGGSFKAESSVITFTPTASSCAGPDPVRQAVFDLSGPNLIISDTSGAQSFMPTSQGLGTTINLQFGCFSNGTFAPGPLAPVSN